MSSKAPFDDPLTLATLPPKNETEEQKSQREQEEDRARKVSLDIDEQIKKDRAAFKRRQKAVKVLLLGQLSSYHPPGSAQCPSRAKRKWYVVDIPTRNYAYQFTGKSTTIKSGSTLELSTRLGQFPTCRLSNQICIRRLGPGEKAMENSNVFHELCLT
jgi:hypothetical protein